MGSDVNDRRVHEADKPVTPDSFPWIVRIPGVLLTTVDLGCKLQPTSSAQTSAGFGVWCFSGWRGDVLLGNTERSGASGCGTCSSCQCLYV